MVDYTPPVKYFYWRFRGSTSFVEYFFCFFFMCYVCHAFASFHCCLMGPLKERVGLLALVCDVYSDLVNFPFGILGQVWCLIVSNPNLCPLSYFEI